MLPTIANYQKLKANIPHLLEISGYRNDYIAKKIGMVPSNFSVKKTKGSWTDSEIEKIMNVLTAVNEEVEDFLMTKIMNEREVEPVMSYEEYKAEFNKRYKK